ncbi:hypothetical protein [Hazenella coriacea]|uniref:Uncharacterized protein n=1 Tax=Hazenella coriacea TaxID=1179467 RepID=A0A4R3L7M2_9BACL|nr:hypothetical protein [Hazenella coriacea]TCS95773.1 hypothetical protein EDD58_102354 [Hazenella coriacea]
MSNELNDKKNPLSPISYEILYSAMKKRLPKLLIHEKGGNVFFAKNLYPICHEVVEDLRTKVSKQFFAEMSMDETVLTGSKNNFVTLNFQNKEREHEDLQELMDLMKKVLDSQGVSPKPNRLSDILTKTKPAQALGSFSIKMQNEERKTSFGKLEYNVFDSISEKNILRHDNVKISYKTDHLMESIKQSLIRYFEVEYEDDFFKDTVIEQIRSQGILADTLYNFIEENHFAAVKRSSGFLYLDYLLSNMDTKFIVKHKETVSLLKRYTERFEKLEELLTEFLKEARYLPVEFMGENRDILNTFRHKNDVYGFLPFMGVLSQIMASTNNNEKNIEQYGVSLKLNGEVQNAEIAEGKGKRSYVYHTQKLISLAKYGDQEDYFETTKEMANEYWFGAIRVVLLKYFLLNLEDGTYDPSDTLKQDLDHIASYDGSPKREDLHSWYRDLAKTFFYKNEYRSGHITEQLNEIREMLCDHFKKVRDQGSTKTYKRRMTFLKSILEPNLFSADRVNVLRNELNTHNYKYTILTKEILEDSLFSFEYEIEFSNTFLCSKEHHEEISYQNEVCEQDEILPIMFLPYDIRNRVLGRESTQYIQQDTTIKKVCIPYPEFLTYETPVEEFVFLFVFKLFVYLFLVAYTEQIREKQQNLFLSFWHFHQHNDNREDEYTKMGGLIRQYTKELEFLFGMNSNTGSQGFVFGTFNQKYKIGNAIHSVYANVPKKFKLDVPIKIPKIAIVIITSMKSDFQVKGDYYRTGVFGEVYTIDSTGSTSTFRRYGTYFDHYNETVYEQSKVLVDIVQKLYEEGYRHVLYVAKTPFTTKFLNKKNNQKELYFMNQKLMDSLYVAGDIAIYPLHVTLTRAYEAHEGKQRRKVGLFVDDTSHIQKSLYEDHVGIIPVFQLYSGNGLPVKEQRHVYNSLITYQTWSRIYSDEVMNNKIQSALIDPNGIKPNLIRALVLLHTSRFESKNKPTIKVDPYSRLFGDEGVAKKSGLDVKWGKKAFQMNMLAYFSYLHTKVFAIKEVEGR